MLIIGAIVLFLLAAVGIAIYLSMMVSLALFFALALAIAFAVGDPYLGFFLAIPATWITLWLVGRNSNRGD